MRPKGDGHHVFKRCPPCCEGCVDTLGDEREYLLKAQRFLDEGQFEAAREAIERGYERDPTDRSIQEMYQQVFFAHGVRQARRARDLRRDSLKNRARKAREPMEDPPEVAQAFRSALESFDRVLQVNPVNAKAVMMKGATLYRMNRRGQREDVRALYTRALEAIPESQELQYALGVIERRCQNCDDTGQCLHCHGTGQVSAVIFRSTCPQCRGSGICTRCSIL